MNRLELSNRAERLVAQKAFTAAARTLETLLATLGPDPSFERAANLARLGRCLAADGRLDAALTRFEQSLDVAQRLEPTAAIAHLRGKVHADLGRAHRDRGDLPAARAAFAAALAVQQRNAEPELALLAARALAEVAMALGDPAGAEDARRTSRHLYGQTGSVRRAMAEIAPFVDQVVAAINEPSGRGGLEAVLVEGEEAGWTSVVAAIRAILAGERDEDLLCQGLDPDEEQIVCAVLKGLAHG
jgi:tetratricopeptide (TPR) repeat protein